jgi:transcriptional regulator of arginine metabolism
MYKRVRSTQTAREMLESPGYLSLNFSGNLGVIKTRPGYASLIAYNIDNADMPDLLGTVAGDDTILLIIKEGSNRKDVIKSLSAIIPTLKD